MAGFTYELAGPKGKILFDRENGPADMLTRDGPGAPILRRSIRMAQYQTVGYIAAYEELIGLIETVAGGLVGQGGA